MTISEVSKKLNVTQDTLRYYEKIGLIPQIERVSKKRIYNQANLDWISLILCMKKTGLSIEELIEFVSLHAQGDETKALRKEILINQKENLEMRKQEIDNTLKYIEFKINLYEKDE